MKTFVLTIEFELFFGRDSGTVENSMIRPTSKLIELLDKQGMKITVFWDVMHYVRLCQLAAEVPELSLDKELIEDKIKQMLEQGHDIQMHLHPHWLDAVWDGSKWEFDYQRYTIQDLDSTPNANDPYTVLGCVTLARQTMERVCRKVRPNYQVTSFRAGSNRTMPFAALGHALRENHIFVDSSAGKGLERSNSFAPINYNTMPDIQFYPFEASPQEFDSNGMFWEFPIETLRIPFVRKCYLNFIKHLKHIETGRYGDGIGVGEIREKEKKPWRDYFSSTFVKFTPEESFPEEWSYMLNTARNMAVAVLQPKNMSPLAFTMLKESLETGEVKFISLQQRLAQLGIDDPSIHHRLFPN